MYKKYAAVLVMIVLSLAAVEADGAKIGMGKTVEYPHAGIAMAVPEGFECRNISEPYDVMRAVLVEKSKSLQAVTLSVFPVAEKVTAEGFADAMTAGLRKVLAVRHLGVQKQVPIRIAGTTGTACTLKYTYRGVRTFAARVYFIRELKVWNVRLCYVLTVESGSEQKGQLLPILGEVMKMLELKPVRHPMNIPIDAMGQAHVDRKHGFSIRPPRGWNIAALPDGVSIGQTDYLQSNLLSPMVRVTVGELDEATTSKTYALKCLEIAKKAFGNVEVVKQGQIKLAGMDGYQFILRHAPSVKRTTKVILKSKSPEADVSIPSTIILQRVVCVPARNGKAGKSYSIVLICHGKDAEKPQAVMDKICAEFKLLEPPTTQPATAETKPAEGK